MWEHNITRSAFAFLCALAIFGCADNDDDSADPPTATASPTVTTTATPTATPVAEFGCGNGIAEPWEEECDDGNLRNGDGCSTGCVLEPGGNACAGIPQRDAGSVRLELVASGLTRPVFLGAAPEDVNRVFVVEQRGRILVVEQGVLLPTPFLDLSHKVVTSTEMGMLSIVFHPDYDTNGTFFVYYLDSVPGVGYRSVVSRFLVSSDPNRADPSSEQIVLTQLQPWNVHKGGLLSFGPDGFLYVPFGDGGLSQSQQDNGQKLDTWLGKILRIDVNSGTPFAVPADNPFVGVAGAMGEIWTMGLRNPWRVTIDQETGNIYLGDVGESRWEEIDVIPAGSTAMNFGWDRMEGNHCLAAEGCEDGAYDAPALEYPHEDGACSVIGGYVYRGCAMPELRGTYFYADYCKAFVRSFVYDAGEITAEHDWTDELQPDGRKLDRITTFGQDARRELYVCDQDGEVFKLVAD